MIGRLCAVVVLCGLLCAGGCGIEEINRAAVRTSLSGERDRQLALETLGRLPEEAQDYKIGPSDVLEVGVFQWELSEETKTLAVRVSQEGTVSLPLVGDLYVAGKTVHEVRVMIEDALKDGDLILNPRVSVVITEFRSKRVAVVGAVRDPGVYTLRQNVTRLLDIVSLAGGLSDTAGQYLHVVRTREGGQEKQVITVDLYDLLELGDLTLNVVVTNGDVVSVPVAPKFFVYGYVAKPGAYDLKRNTTALEAVATAGGLQSPVAAPSACVLRRNGEEISVDLTEIAGGDAPDIYLQANDVLDVRSTFLRKTALVLWEGVQSLFHVGYSLNR